MKYQLWVIYYNLFIILLWRRFFFFYRELLPLQFLTLSNQKSSFICPLVSVFWFLVSGFCLVEVNGIEPMTSCVQGRRSPNWATPPGFRSQKSDDRSQTVYQNPDARIQKSDCSVLFLIGFSVFPGDNFFWLILSYYLFVFCFRNLYLKSQGRDVLSCSSIWSDIFRYLSSGFCLLVSDIGGPRWTWTIDLTLIRRAL